MKKMIVSVVIAGFTVFSASALFANGDFGSRDYNPPPRNGGQPQMGHQPAPGNHGGPQMGHQPAPGNHGGQPQAAPRQQNHPGGFQGRNNGQQQPPRR